MNNAATYLSMYALLMYVQRSDVVANVADDDVTSYDHTLLRALSSILTSFRYPRPAAATRYIQTTYIFNINIKTTIYP